MRPVVAKAEFGADVVAVGMIDLVEYAQGMCPCPPGRTDVARTAVNVAEVIGCRSFVVPVGKLAAEIDGPLVARDGS